MKQKYSNIIKLLKGLKGLTDNEALVFFEICRRDSVSVKEVLKIFQKLKIKISRTKVYTIVEKYRRERLIFPSGDLGKTQRFRAVHPKGLFNDLQDSFDVLDKEIALLSEAYEIHDFDIKDPRKLSKTLFSEPEILSVCNSLCSNSKIVTVSKNNPEFEHFFKSLSRLGDVITGNIDVILFNNHNNDDKGVITLTRRPGKDGNARIFGQITYDEEKYNYFYDREVKGIGQS